MMSVIPRPPQMTPASGERPRILVVDDAPENLAVLLNALKDDYTVIGARNGLKALQLAAAIPAPDLILLDIVMPEMDGYQVCARLKEEEATRAIPVIFLTSLEKEESEILGLSLGAVDYIRKPIRIATLHLRVKLHLKLARRFRPVVLVVDDDAFERKRAGQMLGAGPYDLVYAASGAEALGILSIKRPDLILMDLVMPETTGLETLRSLKAVPQFAGIPVMMITGQGEKDMVGESLDAGAVDFMVKPLDRDVFLEKMAKFLIGERRAAG